MSHLANDQCRSWGSLAHPDQVNYSLQTHRHRQSACHDGDTEEQGNSSRPKLRQLWFLNVLSRKSAAILHAIYTQRGVYVRRVHGHSAFACIVRLSSSSSTRCSPLLTTSFDLAASRCISFYPTPQRVVVAQPCTTSPVTTVHHSQVCVSVPML